MSDFAASEEACPHCFDDSCFQKPTLSQKVYKDECMYCYSNSSGTVYVCMCCFQGVCQDHLAFHDNQSKANPHKLFLQVRKLPKAKKKAAEDITDLTQVGFEEPDEFETKVVCKACKVVMPDNVGETAASVSGIKGALSPQLQATIDESRGDSFTKECPHVKTMVQADDKRQFKPGNKPANDEKCGSCDHKKNNWLCLTCGNIGCPRKEAGGSEHAIFHYMMFGHPTVVKMGTITPAGADMYCYACDDAVRDDQLAKHLAHFGINMHESVKTAKSMAEMELDQTAQYDFGKLTEAGADLKVRYGPAHTGLINLGNSCYMNSVLQAMFCLPEFKARFYEDPEMSAHQQNCTRNPADCYSCQMSKLATGFYSGKRSVEGQPDHQQGIGPRDFKTYIAKGHKDFSSGQQQDAEEYTRYLLQQLFRKQKELAPDAEPSVKTDPSRLFDFLIEERKQCSKCSAVRYTQSTQNTLCLDIPLSPPTDPTAKVEDDKRPRTDLDACLDRFLAPGVIDCRCDSCGQAASYTATTKLASFPEVIAIHPRREYFDKSFLTTRKMDCFVDFPEMLDLARTEGRGLQDGEVAMAEGAPEASATAASSAFQPDEIAFATLLSMGIEEPAALWALENTQNNTERAVDWVFSHPEGPPPAGSGANANADQAPPKVEAKPLTNGSPKYEMFAMVSHIGSSALTGHYIAHVKKEGAWSNCNDETVKFSQNPPFHMASLFFYRRV